jgi:hypothetical protein
MSEQVGDSTQDNSQHDPGKDDQEKPQSYGTITSQKGLNPSQPPNIQPFKERRG